MNVIAINTSTNVTEIFLIKDSKITDELKWDSGRQLAKDLLLKIDELLKYNKLDLKKIDGYLAYLGPGSFTGLRIGISTLNALAYVNNKPIVGSTSDNWLNDALLKLNNNQDEKILLPEYGSEAHITPPKK